MIISEDQAIKKWCPFVQINNANDDKDGDNRGYGCIASKCMAWRVVQEGTMGEDSKIRTPLVGEEAEKARMMGYVKEDVQGDQIIWRKSQRAVPGTGFCGAASTPVQLLPAPVAGSVTESKKVSRPAAPGTNIIRNDQGEEFDADLIAKMAGIK
jgi:hypothetical protein